MLLNSNTSATRVCDMVQFRGAEATGSVLCQEMAIPNSLGPSLVGCMDGANAVDLRPNILDIPSIQRAASTTS